MLEVVLEVVLVDDEGGGDDEEREDEVELDVMGVDVSEEVELMELLLLVIDEELEALGV